MLKIENLSFQIEDKLILDKLNLEIKNGEIHILMGSNGAGKSSLVKLITGYPGYKAKNGTILYNDYDILKMEVYERAQKGIFLAMQEPISIDGVSNFDLLREIKKDEKNLSKLVKDIKDEVLNLKLDNNYLEKSINKNLSGGEKKKSELLQMKFLKPSFIIFDEIDSGLDLKSLKDIALEIDKYQKENKDASFLIITHNPKFLDYIDFDYAHILKDKNISKTINNKADLDIFIKEGFKND